MGGDYSEIAEEYYDPTKHPTSNDFNLATATLIAEYIVREPPSGAVCEVGAGLSAAVPLLSNLPSVERLVSTDASERMLEYSKKKFPGLAEFIVCDARSLPFDSGSFDLVLSSLGDPYNEMGFWREANRVTKENGKIFFTTPSWEWARAFRANEKRSGKGMLSLSIV